MDPQSLDALLRRYHGRRRDALVPALWEVQERYGHIGPDAVKALSHVLRVPEAEIYGVIGFYSLFTTDPTPHTTIRVCTSPACLVRGAGALLDELDDATAQTPDGATCVEATTCLGLCNHAPAVLVSSPGTGLHAVAPAPDAGTLLAGGGAVAPDTLRGARRLLDVADPTRAETLAEYGGYDALARALAELSPEGLIAEIERAGLVGRGGAAFPTARKWALGRASGIEPRYVIANADESEPGTFKDRVLMELRPHLLIEGLALCGYAVGARQGYIFIRGEYPAATRRLEAALAEARAAGYLGERILGTDFTFEIEIRRGAGAYISGEETALFETMEGRRGFPRIKPPFPTTHGLFGKPTVVNNVETLSVVPLIVRCGGESMDAGCTGDEARVKLVCVSGHVRYPGVYEIPLGTRLRDLLEDQCGGVEGELQAVLMGGAAGAFLTPDEIDVAIDFDTLRAAGATLGSGAIMVFNTTVDLRDVLHSLAEFFQHESCGKCYPCQLGTQRQLEIIARLEDPLPGDARRLTDVGLTMREASLCGLGQTASMAVLSALEKWPGLFGANGHG